VRYGDDVSDNEPRQVIIRMPSDVHDTVKDRADTLGWSMAEWIRQAIDHYQACDNGEARERRAMIERLA
jgi:hypothetical protein